MNAEYKANDARGGYDDGESKIYSAHNEIGRKIEANIIKTSCTIVSDYRIDLND